MKNAKANRKWMCNSCEEISLETDLLKAPNPFDNSRIILGCPKCHSVEDFTEICDEDNCIRPASCGFPTDDGYRRTCYEHSLWPRR